MEKHVPVRRRRNTNIPAWMRRGVLRTIRRKKRLWAKVKKENQKGEYKEAEKTVRNLISSKKQNF